MSTSASIDASAMGVSRMESAWRVTLGCEDRLRARDAMTPTTCSGGALRFARGAHSCFYRVDGPGGRIGAQRERTTEGYRMRSRSAWASVFEC